MISVNSSVVSMIGLAFMLAFAAFSTSTAKSCRRTPYVPRGSISNRRKRATLPGLRRLFSDSRIQAARVIISVNSSVVSMIGLAFILLAFAAFSTSTAKSSWRTP